MTSIAKSFIGCFIIFLTSCTSQRPYPAHVYIENHCSALITVVSYNDTGGYLDFPGKDKLIIAPGKREAWLVFNLTIPEAVKDISPFFIDHGNDNLRVVFSDGEREKVFNSRQIISLMKNITPSNDERRGITVYEISDKSICPNS
ncbi:hypothetical protein AAIG33_21330 [Phytobacter ursingii]|uniref:hypothetical protein n=1 Tax=Phytobacter ursingii TaxID=1972431 RepID=UPI0012B7B25B